MIHYVSMCSIAWKLCGPPPKGLIQQMEQTFATHLVLTFFLVKSLLYWLPFSKVKSAWVLKTLFLFLFFCFHFFFCLFNLNDAENEIKIKCCAVETRVTRQPRMLGFNKTLSILCRLSTPVASSLIPTTTYHHLLPPTPPR